MRTSLEHVETEFQLRWPHDTTLCLTWWFNVLWAFLGIDGLTSPAVHRSFEGANKESWGFKAIFVLSMSFSFWLLGVESRDFSQAEKERTLAKLSKFTKWQLFSLKMVLGCLFEWKWVSFCKFALLCKQFFLSQLEKNHVTQLPTAKN